MLNKKKILIVEDDLISAEYLKSLLECENYEIVDVVDTGASAIKQSKVLKPDIVLMDIMLRDNISGCEAAVEIKRNQKECKIIFLTAYAEKEMIDFAVCSEAYGYLIKPYVEKMILATIELAFSHEHSEKPVINQDIIELQDGYVYNIKLNRLLKDGKELPLGKKPLKLIQILAKNKNTSVSNEQICYHIWGRKIDASTLRSLIHRIRHVIGSNIIRNVNGMGYSIG